MQDADAGVKQQVIYRFPGEGQLVNCVDSRSSGVAGDQGKALRTGCRGISLRRECGVRADKIGRLVVCLGDHRVMQDMRCGS